MDKVLLVGFSGKIGSGKDYVAKNIFLPLLEKKQKIKYAILAFADSLHPWKFKMGQLSY